jgi:DNA polymerase IV
MNSALLGKPVIIGGTSDRGVVASCSYEARAFGIHAAMPVKLAKRLCPDALIVRGDYEQYSKYSDIITAIIAERVPVYEKSSIDEFYIDMTGMDRFFGSYRYAGELRQYIMRQTGLPISFGFSTNKTVSKVATGEAKPNNQMRISNGAEQHFMAPLTIDKIPGIGPKTAATLRSMGVERVRTLQQMPPVLVQNVLGEHGKTLWQKANGIDQSPVEPYNERKSISTEETFDTDTTDVDQIKNILLKMTEQLAYRLRNQHKLTACITLKIRYTNFDTHTMQCRIPYTASDHTLMARVKELFNKLYTRRMLIRLVGIKFSHLVSGGTQVNLFEDSSTIVQLYQTMDKIRQRFGNGAVQRAIGNGARIRSFNPFNGQSADS